MDQELVWLEPPNMKIYRLQKARFPKKLDENQLDEWSSFYHTLENQKKEWLKSEKSILKPKQYRFEY